VTKLGAASILIDPPHVRPDGPTLFHCDGRDRDAYVQYVVEVRRALDILSTRPEVDSSCSEPAEDDQVVQGVASAERTRVSRPDGVPARKLRFWPSPRGTIALEWRRCFQRSATCGA
jgi:hypothetical protein